MITDFVHLGDRIAFRDAGFDLGADEGMGGAMPQAIDPALLSSRTNGTFAAEGNRFAYASATGRPYYDADGHGTAASRQLVLTLDAHPALTAADLFFVA